MSCSSPWRRSGGCCRPPCRSSRSWSPSRRRSPSCRRSSSCRRPPSCRWSPSCRRPSSCRSWFRSCPPRADDLIVFNVRSTETRIRVGASRSSRTFRARFAFFVHFSSNIVTCWTVVTSVKLGKPLAINELGHTAAHLVGVGPDHGGVVPDVGAEPKGLYSIPGEELDLVVPVRDAPGPVGSGTLSALLINVEVLADQKSGNFSTSATIMRENALICVPLRHQC